MTPAQTAFDFIDHCSGDSGDTVVSKLVSCGKSFGFDHLILTGLPAPNERFERLVVLNRWPGEWYQRFTQRDYFPLDGVGQWAMRTNQPFTYSEVPDALRLPRKAKRVRMEAAEFGLADGFVVPIRLAGYRQSGFSFSCGSRCDLGPQDRAALHFIAIYAAGFLRNMLDKAPCRDKLTAREREVLAWAALGKSAWETSAILSISERTVGKHLEHVRNKLNAATTAQAVAEALRFGEIVL